MFSRDARRRTVGDEVHLLSLFFLGKNYFVLEYFFFLSQTSALFSFKQKLQNSYRIIFVCI